MSFEDAMDQGSEPDVAKELIPKLKPTIRSEVIT